jgi:protein phosphatase
LKIAPIVRSDKDKWSAPSAEDFISALEGATGVMKALKARGSIVGGKIAGALIEIPDIRELVIIGDLHGDFNCLARILEEIDFKKFLEDPTNKIVFLGDYIDRGSNSIGVLYSLCRLKMDYPESIMLMRGNHEAPSEFPFSSHDYPFQISEKFGEERGRLIYRNSLSLFRELAVAVTIGNTLLLVHGGLPTPEGTTADFRTKLSRAPESHLADSVLEEILWNDPRELTRVPGWEPSRRGIGRHFGEDITDRWLNATGTVCVVRGHEPCKGYRLDHGDKVLTLFSSKEPYPSFEAAYLRIGSKDIELVRNARSLLPFVRYPVLT